MKKSLYLSAITAAVIVSFFDLKTASGKLVYDKDLPTQNVGSAEGTSARYEQAYEEPSLDSVEREEQPAARPQPRQMKQAAVAPARPVTVVQNINTEPQDQVIQSDADLADAAPSQAAQRPETRSEKLRRQRLREELKNEDLLTQKLEELRLKDELTRTDKILGSGVEKKEESEELKEEKIGSAAAMPAATVSTAPVAAESSSSVAVVAIKDASAEEAPSMVTVTPRAGISNISTPIYEVESKYSAGLEIGMDMNEYISFQAGYTFSKYSLSAGSAVYNPYSYGMQQLEMNDNVIDMGGRVHLLGKSSKVRPFIGAGIGYRKGYVNYDDATLRMLRNNYAYGNNTPDDIELSAFMGYIETGLEIKFSKNVGLSGMFRYFNVLSSTQSNPVDAQAFVTPYGGGYSNSSYLVGGYNSYGAGNYGYTSDARNQAGSALADSNFYQLLLGLNISF